MGYRRGTVSVDPIPVGVVLVETIPRRAEVVVGDREADKSPRAFPNVPAGEVPVVITKDGYAPWQKRVPVRPGLVTDVRQVRLFADNVEPVEVAPDVQIFAVSPNRRLIATVGAGRQFSIIDPEGTTILGPLTLRQEPEQLFWSPNSAAVLIQSSGETYEVAEVASRIGSRPLPALQGAHEVTWDYRIPSRLLVHARDASLRAYNILNNSSTVIDQKIVSFATSARSIFTLHVDGSIHVFTLQGAKNGVLPVKSQNAQGHLLVTPDGQLVIWQPQGPVELYRDDQLQKISDTAASVLWSPDGQTLLIQSDPISLYVYNVSDRRSTIPEHELRLVTRLSRPIINPVWFAGGQHILYQVGDEIIITETDTRDHAVSFTVDTVNHEAATPAVGEEGKDLFYLKNTEAGLRLVRRLLILEED